MSIRLSDKHGVNPSLSVCFLCGEDKNEILILGMLPGDKEAPRRSVYNKEPCDKCKSYMKRGIILISVRNNETDMNNPYRTGGFVVVKDEAVKKIFGPESPALKIRAAFVEDEVWDKVGLPRGENFNHLDNEDNSMVDFLSSEINE